MLSTYVNKTIPIQNKHNMINIGYSHNQYVRVQNTYIQSDLRLRLLQETGNVDLLYIRNMFPKNKTPTFHEFDFKFYRGSFVEKTDFVIFCLGTTLRSIMSRRLDKAAAQICYYNITNQTIKDELGNLYTDAFVNTEQALTFTGTVYNPNYYILINNMLSKFTILGNHEHIMYPFALSCYDGIYSHFEQQNQETFTFTDYRISTVSSAAYSSLQLNRPRFLFSPDNEETWYSFNVGTSEWVIQTPANGTHFTYSEFISKSNTYMDYLKIGTANFSALADDVRFTVLSTGYIYPIQTLQTFWTDKLDITNTIYLQNTTLCNSTSRIGSI